MANRVLFKEILQNTLLNVQNSILALSPLHLSMGLQCGVVWFQGSHIQALTCCKHQAGRVQGKGALCLFQSGVAVPWTWTPKECLLVLSAQKEPTLAWCSFHISLAIHLKMPSETFSPLKYTDRKKAADWLGVKEACTRFLAWCHDSQQSTRRPETFYQVGVAKPNERLYWALFWPCSARSPCHLGWPSFCRGSK